MGIVREYRDGDMDGVLETVKQVYDEYSFIWDPDDYHADLYALPDSFDGFWVAEEEGRIVGVIGLAVFDPIPGEAGGTVEVDGFVRVCGADCELERLYVRAEARKGGYGGKLTEACINEARRRGCSLMEIWTDKEFEAAHRLYARYGAFEVGERTCHNPENSPEWGKAIRL